MTWERTGIRAIRLQERVTIWGRALRIEARNSSTWRGVAGHVPGKEDSPDSESTAFFQGRDAGSVIVTRNPGVAFSARIVP